MIKRFTTIPGMLLMAALLCTGVSLAQEGAPSKGVIEAADELGLGGFSYAVQSAGLSDILSDQGVLTFGAGSFVIFAPSDEAFAAASAPALTWRLFRRIQPSLKGSSCVTSSGIAAALRTYPSSQLPGRCRARI